MPSPKQEKKIIDYLIVHGETEQELLQLVKENIHVWGWQPIGGIHAHYWDNNCGDGREFDFYQAMVKYE